MFAFPVPRSPATRSPRVASRRPALVPLIAFALVPQLSRPDSAETGERARGSLPQSPIHVRQAVA